MAKKYIYVISYLDGNHLASQDVFADEDQANAIYDAARRALLDPDRDLRLDDEAFEMLWEDYRSEGDYDIYLHKHELKNKD